ncbi:unnamed protein product [marine sediment metagenome]|uniref:Uncharacterized protein n=1 Tax=marine sediment metagenome TaxID=412755 RepID=X1KM78_9ZZZZ
MTWTEEQINVIVGERLKSWWLLDIFNLYGVLHIGNTIKGQWDLKKKFMKLSEGRLSISLEDFEDCKDEEEVRDTFSELLEERVKAKLV